MRKEKLETYNLTGSIHTLQLKTTDEAVPDAEYVNNKTIKKFSRYSDGETISLTLNPNKAEGDIFDYYNMSMPLTTYNSYCYNRYGEEETNKRIQSALHPVKKIETKEDIEIEVIKGNQKIISFQTHKKTENPSKLKAFR